MYNRPLWIVNLDNPTQRTQLQFVPQDLDEDQDNTSATITSPGRNLPIYHHVGGENIIEFTLDWTSNEVNNFDVLDKVRFITSLGQSDGYTKKAPRLKLIWGDTLYSNAIWILHSVKTRYLMYNAVNEMRPTHAMQKIILNRISPTNPTKAEMMSINY